jgi:hypothetical protein
VETLTQSLSFLLYLSHLDLKARAVILKWTEILLISLVRNVGVMVLQQFPQVKQSVSSQISLSILAAIVSRFLGGFFSSLVRKVRNLFLFRSTFFLNAGRFIGCMNGYGLKNLILSLGV